MEFEDITYFLTKLAKIAVHLTIFIVFCHLCKIYVQVLNLACVIFSSFLIRRRLSFLKTFLVFILFHVFIEIEEMSKEKKNTCLQ